MALLAGGRDPLRSEPAEAAAARVPGGAGGTGQDRRSGMDNRLRQIAQKRRMLVAEAAEQRGELAAHAVTLRQKLGWVDMFRRGGSALASRPLLVGAVAAGVMVVGPSRILRFVYRSGLLIPIGLRVFRIIRALR